MKLERFFYHSFPRRSRNGDNELQQGLKILELIRDFGLLLTPEVTAWEYPHADGSPPRKIEMVQIRVCFTELSPSELRGHAEEFGHFALEFEIDALKNLYALPVFYIPRGNTVSLGQTLVIQLIDAMCLIDRIAQLKKFIESTDKGGKRQIFEFGFSNPKKLFSLDIDEMQRSIEGITYATTPPEMLSLALEGALNLFYFADADSSKENEALKYYRQREWRIAGNVGRMGEELMGLPPKKLIDRLLALDAEFFGREFPRQGAVLINPSLASRPFGKRLVDWLFVYQGIDERHIIGMARRVIVPHAALQTAKDILSKQLNAPPVVAIEDII